MAANIVIKKEKITSDDEAPTATPAVADQAEQTQIQNALLHLLAEFPKGLAIENMQTQMPQVTLNVFVSIINKLMVQKKVVMFNSKQDGKLIYRLADGHKLKGADVEESVVLDYIEATGNKGIWTRDLRNKSGLQQTTLNKVLKNLEGKKLIKAVSSVSAGKRKVYMLYNMEPDRSITGGSWYSKDNEFETELVELLYAQSYRLLLQKAESARADPIATDLGPLHVRNASELTSEEILQFIMGLGVIKVSLEKKEFEQVLETLIYDGKVEKTGRVNKKGEMVYKYRCVHSPITSAGAVRIPCGVCPIIERCSTSTGSVRPQSCEYMDQWLQ